MEEYKWRCLSQFLQRNSEVGMDFYIREMRLLEMQARRCYSESITHIQSDDFVLMLLLDGCFILEYFFNFQYQSKENDRIFDSGWGETIKSDLLLLENQIPFFVIHKLISILQGPNTEHREEECVLVDLLLRFFPYVLEANSTKPSCNTIDHLLHLFHTSIVPSTPHSNSKRRGIKMRKEASLKTRILSWLKSRAWRSNSRQSEVRLIPKTIPCASELHEAGVTFFCKRHAKNMFDITFRNGVIEMPLLIISDSTRTIFTNVIAFEQTQPSLSRIFTSFAVLMDLLIDTSLDVVLLQRRHILVHTLRNEKEVAFFFNELADYSFLDHENHYFKNLIDQVQKYSNLAWHKYKARLMHDYFRNPWTSISVFAGIVLLGLTIVQTYYTVYPEVHKNN
ncbi:hypothetical protein LUZ60_013750 [Juncus effusus]|nr:hypothetical protein LUZ60_013750 [Juncus effusus]